MFLVAQLTAILISYLVLYVSLPWFFRHSRPPFAKRSLTSLFYIVFLIVLACIVVFSIPSDFWANRIQHAFAGGFAMMFVCFRAIKDARVPVDPVRFFLIAGLLVTTLGVASEMAEFFFQHVGGYVFADSIDDTWWDLLSNAVGATIGGLLFAPFIPTKD